MAFDKQMENAFLTLTWMMALITFPVTATTNIDCNGKAFYCVNSTHFKICVDFGGVSETVDNFLIACPPATVCSENNYFECEYPVSTTSATVPVQSDVTNEFTEKTSLWELFEVTTSLPVNNHEKSIEFVDQWTKTPIETVFKDEVIETTGIANTPVNEVILDTKNILLDTTLSESANNSSKPIYLIIDSEFLTTAAIDVTKDNLSAITTGATTVDHSRAESELLNDSLNTIVTTPSSKARTVDLKLTKIISPAIIDYLSTKSFSIESYSSSDLTKTVITTPRNNVGNDYFISTTSIVNFGDLSSNGSLAEVINKVNGNNTSIDLLRSDITAASPNLEEVESSTESVINHTTSQNVVKDTNISVVTMVYDSHILSTQQDITGDPIPDVVGDANKFLTNDEMETPRDRLNDSSDFFDNKLDDMSTRTTKADQTELDPTTNINVTLNFTTDGVSVKNSLSSQLVNVDFHKAESITTSSDLYESATSTNHATIQKSTETSMNLPTPTTNDVTKSYSMVNTDTNNKITPITLSPLAISESHLVSESIFKSSTDDTSTSADFYEEIGEDNQLNNTTETNINVLTTVATTLNDFYTNFGQNSSRVGVNDLLAQDQQITADTGINSQTTIATTVHTFYTDIKDNTAQDGKGDLLTQRQKDMTEAGIKSLTTTPTKVDHLNMINDTFRVSINTLFTPSHKNITETPMNSITTTKPTVGDFYTDIINDNSRIGVTAVLMQTHAESTEEERSTDVNFLPTTTNEDEFYSYIENNTSQVGASASFTQSQHEMTETDPNFQTTTISYVDHFNTNITNYTTEVGVLDLLIQNERNMTYADVNFLTTTATNVDEFYSNITNNTAPVEVNALFLQNQQNMTETDMNSLPPTISAEGDFYTNIGKYTTQAGQKNKTDVNFLITTPNNLDYLNITHETSHVWTLFTQSQQSMTEADINVLTTTTKPTVGDFYTDNVNNTFQLGVTNTRMQSQQSITEADINLQTISTTTHTMGDFNTDIINNTSQFGVTNTRLQSSQRMTEADINLLTTSKPTEGDFYRDNTNNTFQLGVTNTRLQSPQRMTEADINLLTTTATPTVGDFDTDNINNTFQLGIINTRMQSQESMTEADINLLATTNTPAVGDFYTDIINNTSQLGFTNTRKQSQQSMTEANINLLTRTTIHTMDDYYIDIGKNTSHIEVNDLYIDENVVSDLPIAKFSVETDKNDDLLDTTTAVNAVLKDIKGLSDDINKLGNVEFTTPMSLTPSDISLMITTESYERKTQRSTNVPDYITGPFMKISNGTSQGLHETSTNNYSIDKITVPIPQVDFTYSDLTTAINIGLNTTADEFTLKALPTHMNDIHPVTNNIWTNPNTTDFFKANIAFSSLPTKNSQQYSTTATADGVHSDITRKDDYEGIKEFLLQQNDIKSTTPISFNTSEHDIDTKEPPKNVPETIVKPDVYGKTEQIDMELSNTQRILDHVLLSKTTTEKNAILDNPITELTRNESDTVSERVVSEYQLKKVGINDSAQIVNRDQGFNNANTNITVTWKPQRDKSNDTFQDLLTAKVTLREITGTLITPTESPDQNTTFTVTEKFVDIKTHKSNTKGSDELSANSKNLFTRPSKNIIHTMRSSEDLNSIKTILQTNVTELSLTTPLQAFVTTETPRTVISDLLLEKNKSNTLRTTSKLRETIFNNTKLEKNINKTTKEETSGVSKVSVKEIAASIRQTNSKVTKNVEILARPTLLTKNLNPQVLSANSTSKNASNTFNTSESRLKDQKNSYGNVLHKTVNIDNASKNVSKNILTLKDPVAIMRDKTTEQTTKTTFDLTNKNGLFNCSNRFRGKYSDKNDCQNFYICIGRYYPIYGKCPNNTVFSEITKQCTRNLSHCIRNNQFKCISPGRYIDIFSDQFYYICVPKAEGYLRFKLKCQNGYHLDKIKLQCVLDSCNGSKSSEDSSKNESDSSKRNTAESKSSKSKEGQSKFLSKQQTEDFECKKEGKFEYPDDCRKYYVCTRNGKSGFKHKIKECDSDEVFNRKKRKCVDDDSYECE